MIVPNQLGQPFLSWIRKVNRIVWRAIRLLLVKCKHIKMVELTLKELSFRLAPQGKNTYNKNQSLVLRFYQFQKCILTSTMRGMTMRE